MIKFIRFCLLYLTEVKKTEEKEKRALCLIVSIVFVLVALSPAINSAMLPHDELDQEQTQCDTALGCLWDDEFAQGFVPTMDTLTRVEILMTRNETAVEGLKIAIRDEPNGGDLASADFNGTIPPNNYTWVEFDFEDVHVTPGETYYIVWSGWHGGANDKLYYWGFGEGDPYPEASSFWAGMKGDFCFKTYGRNNQPPASPETPSGESYVHPGEAYTYSTSTTDPDGDRVKYGWDWNGDGTVDEWTNLEHSGGEVETSHIFYESGTHYVKVKASDEYGKESDWSDSYAVLVADEPPEEPTVIGPTQGRAGESYTYNITATDPNNDRVRFQIEWGDGNEETTAYYNSGEAAEIKHTWSTQGTFHMRVKAETENGMESDWTYLDVTMPKTYGKLWAVTQKINEWFLSLLGREIFPFIM
jgi:hypothetical protein